MTAKKSCISCASKIPIEAQKCVHCGGYQGFRRFFDLGNTALALIIAIISVTALSFDKLKEIYDYTFKYDAKLSIYVESINDRTISLMIANNGGSNALLNNNISCDIPIFKDKSSFCNRDEYCIDKKEASITDIKTIVNFSYSMNGTVFVEKGKQLKVNAVRFNKALEFKQAYETLDIPGYCTAKYMKYDGDEDYALTALEVDDLFGFISFSDYDKLR